MEGIRLMRRVATWLTGLSVALLMAAAAEAQQRYEQRPHPPGIWISVDEVDSLPKSGPAWDNLKAAAQLPLGRPTIRDKGDNVDVHLLAKALVHLATRRASYREEVIDACMAAIGTEQGGTTLALGRNLVAYVIAADLVRLPKAKDAIFRAWLRRTLTERHAGRTLQSTHEDRPNNWGTHAGASRAAVARYLGDDIELDRMARVFKGWLGDRASYASFKYGDLWWQFDPENPVGINPKGAMKVVPGLRATNGGLYAVSIDGLLPDDQRRGGPFEWPPPKENYVYEALQGALVQAVILHRAGYHVWSWGDRALLRAFRWLHDIAGYPAKGDDTWQPHVINYFYGTDFPAPVPARHGKNVGWTDWTFGNVR